MKEKEFDDVKLKFYSDKLEVIELILKERDLVKLKIIKLILCADEEALRNPKALLASIPKKYI